MDSCLICGTYLDSEFGYKFCEICSTDITNNILSNLKPSSIKDLKCEDIYPNEILYDMNDYVKKDINELFRCIENQLWTATVLMSARLLESQLKHYIKEFHFIVPPPKTIGHCISFLKNQQYTVEFTTLLDTLRDLRNEAMHGEKRYGSDSAMSISKSVLIILFWIYSFVV